MRMTVFTITALAAASGLVSAPRAAAEEFVFLKPSDDVWHYPFNFTPGTRDTGPLFGSVGNVFYAGFNDRDGIILIAWNTAAQIDTGRSFAAYDIQAITVTLTHQDCPPGDCGVFIFPATWPVDLTVDEWFTYDANNNGIMDGPEVPDPDPGRPLELFGVGFGPQYNYFTWTQTTPYVGGTCLFGQNVCSFVPRDPFPMTFQAGSGAMLHVEDSVKGRWNEGLDTPLCAHPQEVCPFTPIPWAIGHPIGYTPGAQAAAFDVVFSVNLQLLDGLVKRYFQEQLHHGRVVVAITSLVETGEQEPGNPTFFLKEATEPSGGFPPIPAAKAPKLVIDLRTAPTGDVDGDNHVALDDWAELSSCLQGPNTPPPSVIRAQCLDVFDFDADGDVDSRDAADFFRRFTGGP